MIVGVFDDRAMMGLGEYVSTSTGIQLAHDLWEFKP